MEIEVGIAVFIGLTLVMVAGTLLARRDRRLARIVFAPFVITLAAGSLLVLAGIARLVLASPFVGALAALAALLLTVSGARLVLQVLRSSQATAPRADLTEQAWSAWADHSLIVGGVILIGGLVMLVALLLWGIAQAAG